MTKELENLLWNHDEDYHLPAKNGFITIGVRDDGMVVITQCTLGSIVVSQEEARRLARGIFGKLGAVSKGTAPSTTPQVVPPAPPTPKPRSPMSAYFSEQIAKAKSLNQNAYEVWSADEIDRLKQYSKDGMSDEEIAEHLGRSVRAIRKRLKRLNL